MAEAAGAKFLEETLRRRSEAMRERHAAQALLGRYMEPKIAARLLASGPRRLAGNIAQDATILFSDIRGFTTLTERLGAQEVVAFLNEHFTAMTEEIVAEGGTIDKFIGDAVMAVFGDPGRPRPDDAQRAVRAAIGMTRKRRALDEERATRGQPPIKIGVGIDTGPIVMGSIGSARRLSFTVIGDAVNIAARLETLTKSMDVDILISGTTFSRLDGTIETKELGSVEVKGRVGKVEIRSVIA
jgi:adenylate cyclase